ncbi:hypothetical protein Scep_028215 [Stephania cephalantha]|uniref:ACT domain-containing protein n=1 Tax=Stephania cephalantha TaxID=152367 RepID=A0AAP0EDA3_9MAGN
MSTLSSLLSLVSNSCTNPLQQHSSPLTTTTITTKTTTITQRNPSPSLHLSFNVSHYRKPKPTRASNQAISPLETEPTIEFNNSDSSDSTTFLIKARNQIGLLQIVTRVFRVLGLKVERAVVEFEGDFFVKRFFVTDSSGRKVEDRESLDRIGKALREAIVDSGGGDDGDDGGEVRVRVRAGDSRGVVARRSGFAGRAERMFGLMDGFLKNDPWSLQKDVLHHVEYTVARSRFSFDDFEAYLALSYAIRDRLIERWHDTQVYFKRKDPKRLYFLSLEFLMVSAFRGHGLIGNDMEITGHSYAVTTTFFGEIPSKEMLHLVMVV